MRSTRRLLDRHGPGSLAILASLAAASVAASCGRGDSGQETNDAGTDAPATDGAMLDAGVSDAPPAWDASGFDGGPLPVVCVSSPCATSLVTTRGTYDDDRPEGEGDSDDVGEHDTRQHRVRDGVTHE